MTSTKRFWELDMARGLAVLAMVVYHFSFDLDYFGVKNIPVTEGWWRIFARSIAITFLLIVGISLAISKARHPLHTHRDYLLKGGKIVACALAITAVTLLAVPEAFIFFGILHLIGFSVMLAPWFFRFGLWNLLIGTILIAIGKYLNTTIVATPLLAWLGVPHYDMNTLDWFPVLPWFGVILLGLAVGGFLYQNGKARWQTEWVEKNISGRSLAWLGRHSLIIYLIHQPILILGVLLFSGKIAAFL